MIKEQQSCGKCKHWRKDESAILKGAKKSQGFCHHSPPQVVTLIQGGGSAVISTFPAVQEDCVGCSKFEGID